MTYLIKYNLVECLHGVRVRVRASWAGAVTTENLPLGGQAVNFKAMLHMIRTEYSVINRTKEGTLSGFSVN